MRRSWAEVFRNEALVLIEEERFAPRDRQAHRLVGEAGHPGGHPHLCSGYKNSVGQM